MFDHPATRRVPFPSCCIELLFPYSAYVRLIVVPRRRLVSGGVVISLVQTQMLRSIFAWTRTLYHHGPQSRLQQLGIVDIGCGHHDAQWPTVGLYEDTALGPRLAAVGRVAANCIPPKRALPIDASADCHSQSTPPNSSQRVWMTAQTRGNTPADSHL